ncbi:MAG: dihydrofolate reductase family protein, partial [Gaiellaceae bacterium]
DPGGAEGFKHGGWTFQYDRGPEGDKFKLDELLASDAQLLGRRTYEGFAKAWPSIEDDQGFAARMNAMPKFVVSTTLERGDWNNTTVLGGDLTAEIGRLKERFEGDILVAGSAQLVQSLLELGLVDELRLMVFPVLLGQGKRLFADPGKVAAFKLADTRQAGACAILTLELADPS